MTTRLEKAERLAKRSERLRKFCELNAPEFLIEQARQLVFESVMKFPVDFEALERTESMNQKMQEEQGVWLTKTGYFKDVDNV